MPEGKYEQLRSLLEESDIPVVDYKAGDRASRQQAVNSIEGVKFKNSTASFANKINTTGEGGVRYKVLTGVWGVNGTLYNKVVQPGTVAFENLKRNRTKYINHLHAKIFNRKIPVTDIHGEKIYVEFAKPGEMVKKIGVGEPHEALGMLSHTKDNLTRIAILNVKELLQNSTSEPLSNENSHGWLDEFGWQDRKVMMLYKDVLYPVILHIANTDDGRYLLYEISVLKKEEQGMTRYAKAPTADSARAPAATDEHRPAVNNSFVLLGERVPQLKANVKQISSTDSDGNQLSSGQQEYFAESEAVDENGNLLALYHQTAEDITEFDPMHPGAGRSDYKTPFGIFLKRTDKDIGLKGKKQMRLYANAKNPLRAENREELVRKLRDISHEYAAVCDEIAEMDRTYKKRVDDAGQKLNDYMIKWRQNNPDASRRAIYDDATYNELSDAEDALVDEWVAKDDKLSSEAKEIITAALIDAGYDSVFLAKDIGSFGRETDAIIVLNPNQVKSVDNKNPTDNPNIHRKISAMASRQMLADAFEGMVQSEDERKLVDTYRRYLDAAGDLEAPLVEVRRQIQEKVKANAPKEEIAALRNQAASMQTALDANDAALLSLEAAQPIRDLMDKASKAYAKQRVSAARQKANERANLSKKGEIDKLTMFVILDCAHCVRLEL